MIHLHISDFPYDNITKIGRPLVEFKFLPDLNLVSRMANIAEYGHVQSSNKTAKFAANLMAYAQCLDMEIEPSIAFHELAHTQGNETAHKKLSWFRSADTGNAQAWINLALGKDEKVKLLQQPSTNEDLAFPLRCWNRNYVAALKIGELELQDTPNIDKFNQLLDWMYNDFMLAGPALMYAALYLAPNARRKGLFKQLRSQDRTKALEGVRNAAWDMTHMSDFVLRVNESSGTKYRYIFATGDKLLSEITPILLLQPEASHGQPSIYDALKTWWPDNDDARFIYGKILRYIGNIDAGNQPNPRSENNNIETLISNGEEVIRSYCP